MGDFREVVPKKPPMEKSVEITRWQGTSGANGFLRSACPTAWLAFGFPRAIAMFLYVDICPLGICLVNSYTLLANDVGGIWMHY
ncbi:MAG: hypothetical protein Harvfovirus53_11 [Harvfovirus sp.]|uniref:Uncharacterized protein n=1 Tax=Harvfovirus sp. TaxID=2487768 RepID=A0A3G5A630_9VIRU|nr:MAG: hypothetical protein Harvfovirus53_11 [Harvfovirus sp.]